MGSQCLRRFECFDAWVLDAFEAFSSHELGTPGSSQEESFGHLGNGEKSSQSPLKLVSGDHTFTAIAAGGYHTCAINDAASMWCWGY